MIRRLLLLVLVLPLVPSAAAVEQEHRILLHEYAGGLHITPERINAKVGDTLKMTIVNQGASPHNFLVCGDGPTPLEKCDERWGFTGMIATNESALVTFTVPRAGTFDYYCYVAGHKGAGMKGTLVVAEESNKTPAPSIAAIMGILAVAALVAARRRSH